MMVGSVMRRNRTKHWSRSLQSPVSQAVDAERHVVGFSLQISKAILDYALQQKA